MALVVTLTFAAMSLVLAVCPFAVASGGAYSPARVDPFIQQGEGLMTRESYEEIEADGAGDLGESVALASHGNTALVGASDTAWIFTRTGQTWSRKGQKLTFPESYGRWGYSVALSADGRTALIGGPGSGWGTVAVFTRTGSMWTEQALIPRPALSRTFGFGSSVALSASGNTALIQSEGEREGPPDPEGGAAWVFTRKGSTWTRQGNALSGVGGSGSSNASVTLSSDGNTALIGSPEESVASVFTRSGTTWTRRAGRLTGTGQIGEDRFGHSVALTSDGNTALIGGPEDNGGLGAAWVFTRTERTWSQKGSKLTGKAAFPDSIGREGFGYSVALSSEGNTALIGGPGYEYGYGAAWFLTRIGTTWTQQGEPLGGEGEDHPSRFGHSVALSSDGNTALVGNPEASHFFGAAWVFVPASAPAVTDVSPAAGATGGGTTVTIHGTSLGGAHAVSFGSTRAVSFTVNSATSITAVSPSEAAGTVDVTVTTSRCLRGCYDPEGMTSAISSHDRFTFDHP